MSEAVSAMDQNPSDSLVVSVRSRARVSDSDADDVRLACGEAVSNALEHGKPPVTVDLSWNESSGLTVVVRDGGKWVVSAATPPRGLGLPIMMALMDNVTIDTTDGTAIRLSRRF
jgi:anti-sigma regulatory factor (Ser/Thr protein kinase)